ncbi:hypothetical protein PSECIP111854_02014 [Pseudoalteromonas sp. CIP111854]|uniref:Uncharacterized protein n=1 Tax=Pseudoalteromonas holothuriae TaxID=2963714 RepID=A0A9W4QWY9_9GAMM|nr:hypothetical protein PSECIP111854_02014 [Pseudoalteromonas sp. CIP111854]
MNSLTSGLDKGFEDDILLNIKALLRSNCQLLQMKATQKMGKIALLNKFAAPELRLALKNAAIIIQLWRHMRPTGQWSIKGSRFVVIQSLHKNYRAVHK